MLMILSLFNTPLIKISTMDSYQNKAILHNLYTLRALGVKYIDPISINDHSSIELPNTFKEVKNTALNCHLCDLSKVRKQVLFGEGDENSDIFFVTDHVCPSADDENSFYAGRSGELFTNMIQNVLERTPQTVYVTHALKCKLPINSQPSQTQLLSCKPYLLREIELVKPKLVITLGEASYFYLTGDNSDLQQIHGREINRNGYTIIPTFHPAFLLRNPSMKKMAFNDLKIIKAHL